MVQLSEFQPPHQAFRHPFVVAREHIDELGHAGNVTWLSWVNDAAIAHSRSAGMTPEEYARLGVVWVVRKHEIEYLVQALEGEAICAMTWIADRRAATSLRRTVFIRESDGKLLARAATTWALIDIATGRPRRIPADLMARYGFATE